MTDDIALAHPPHRFHWLEVAHEGLEVSVESSIGPDQVGVTITPNRKVLRHGAIAEPPTGTRHYR